MKTKIVRGGELTRQLVKQMSDDLQPGGIFPDKPGFFKISGTAWIRAYDDLYEKKQMKKNMDYEETNKEKLRNLRASNNFWKLKDKLKDFCIKNHELWTGYRRENDYWIYFDIDEKEFKVSGPLTSSTCPNPANWFPNTEDILFDYLNATNDLWMDVDDDTIEYYQDDPYDFFADYPTIVENIWDEFLAEISKELRTC